MQSNEIANRIASVAALIRRLSARLTQHACSLRGALTVLASWAFHTHLARIEFT